MYLVPAADYDAVRLLSQPPPPVKAKRETERSRKTASQHPHDKWIALRTKLLEADINGAVLIHRFADFLRKVLPQPAPKKTPQRHPSADQRHKIETVDIAETPQQSLVAQRPVPPSAGTSYEVSKRRPNSGGDAAESSDSDDDGRGIYEVSSSYLNTVRFLGEQYGMRRDGSTLLIGSAAVNADEKGRISIRGRVSKERGVFGNS